MARAMWWQQRSAWRRGIGGACLLAFLVLSAAALADDRDKKGDSRDAKAGSNNSQRSGGGNPQVTVQRDRGNSGLSSNPSPGNNSSGRRVEAWNQGHGSNSSSTPTFQQPSSTRTFQQPSSTRMIQPSGASAAGQSTNPTSSQPRTFSKQGAGSTSQPASNLSQPSNTSATRQQGSSTQTFNPAAGGHNNNLGTSGNTGIKSNVGSNNAGSTGGANTSSNAAKSSNAANLAPKLPVTQAPVAGQNLPSFPQGKSNPGNNNPGTRTATGGQTQPGAGISDVRRRLGGGNDSQRVVGGSGNPSGTNTNTATNNANANTNKNNGTNSNNSSLNLVGPGAKPTTGHNGPPANKGTTGTDKGTVQGANKGTAGSVGSVTGPTISGHGPSGTASGGSGTGTSGTAGAGVGKLDVGKLNGGKGDAGKDDAGKLGVSDPQHRVNGPGGHTDANGTTGQGTNVDKSFHNPGLISKTPGNLPAIGPIHGAGELKGHAGDAVKADHVGMPPGQLQQKVAKGELDAITKSKIGTDVKLADQYRLADKGDVARRLKLHDKNAVHDKDAVVADLKHGPGPDGGPHHEVDALHFDHGHPGPPHPGFHHHPYFVYFGFVSPIYYNHCIEFNYWGPSWYASTVWYPQWNPWVHWSWYYHPHPIWDPRPIWCRPIIYAPAPLWVYWETPAWTPLPEVACGTWVDVNRVVIEPERRDLQLLAVRFVDPGHPEEKLGPRYRVWFRNNGEKPIQQGFNIALFASEDGILRQGVPQAGVRVTAIDPGDTQSVDIRLPFEVYQMKKDAEGKAVPFTSLHVLVDANREIDEISKDNNGAVLAPADVLPVDPAAFQIDPAQATAGTEILLAGEGLGPEPGKVVFQVGQTETEAEILGWYDLGIRFKVPDLKLAGPTPGELVVIRGDGAAANPLTVALQPGTAPAVAAPPAPPAPAAPAVPAPPAPMVEAAPNVKLIPAAPPAVQ